MARVRPGSNVRFYGKIKIFHVFDPKETHEHIFDLDNFGRFLEKIFKKSNFDDFSRTGFSAIYRFFKRK